MPDPSASPGSNRDEGEPCGRSVRRVKVPRFYEWGARRQIDRKEYNIERPNFKGFLNYTADALRAGAQAIDGPLLLHPHHSSPRERDPRRDRAARSQWSLNLGLD
jgi:hypothetical protein